MNKRRDFMRALVACAGVSAMPLFLKLNLARAASVENSKASGQKTLLVVFQRGGCDGLNTIIPYTEDYYYQLRPTIAIAPPDSDNPQSAIAIDGQFGFHPALAPLLPIYQLGQMAILPTVHYANASRSHFSSQHLIESALVGGSELTESDGWLNRYLQSQQNIVQFRGVGIGSELAQSLRGDATAASLSSIDSFRLHLASDEQSLLLARLNQVYGQGAGASPTRQLLHKFGAKAVADLAVIQQVRELGYSPANGAIYPNSQFGRDMRQVAQLIKAGIGLEVAAVTIGGWDHHANQGGGESTGAQAGAHRNYAQGIVAFHQDLAELMGDVVVLVQTEFGRTAAENGSGGTDHGAASTWYLMGAGVQGGMYGAWPELAVDQLAQGRYLQHTVDYRDIYGAVLQKHLQVGDSGLILSQHDVIDLGLFG